jgi:hypothetical protein
MTLEGHSYENHREPDQKLRAVSSLEPGDKILVNGTVRIFKYIRSSRSGDGYEISYEGSNERLIVENESEEIEVPS